jgi:RHS repeat-associated protein
LRLVGREEGVLERGGVAVKRLAGMVVLLVASLAAAQGAPVVNENTGDLSYQYAFELPKARGYYQPSLALVYSSASSQNTGYGYGWALTSTFIEVDSRGSPGKATLWISDGGERKLLVTSGTNKYRPEVEDSFFEVTAATGGTYTAVDARATTYKFDRLIGARAYLTRVQDILGNIVEFAYEADKEDPVEIRYNNYPAGSTTPSYAAHVSLEYEQDDGIPAAAVAGVLFDRKFRLHRVRIEGPTGQTSPAMRTVRGYEMAYGGAAGLRYLWTITAYGGDFAVALPPTVFEWDLATYWLDGAVPFAPPDMSILPYWFWASDSLGDPLYDRGAEWIDLDGDGRADAVWKSFGTEMYWARNVTPIGSNTAIFEAAVAVATPGTGDAAELMDFDGDGVMDLVRASVSSHKIYRGGSGAGVMAFSTTPVSISVDGWVSPDYSQGVARGTLNDPNVRMIDLNGDGVVDYARNKSSSPCGNPGEPTCQWQYGLVRFDPSGTSAIVGQSTYYTAVPSGRWFSITDTTKVPSWLGMDFNGDGLADAIFNDGNTNGSSCPSHTGEWRVVPNRGGALWSTDAVQWGSSGLLAGYGDVPTEVFESDINQEICSSHAFCDPRFVIGDLLDLNADGRPDFVARGAAVWNTGRSFATTTVPILNAPPYVRYEQLAEYQWNSAVPCAGENGRPVYECCGATAWSPNRGRYVDLNGDGILDFVTTDASAAFWFQPGGNDLGVARPALLRGVLTPDGGTYTVEYASSSIFGAPARSRKAVVTAVHVGGRLVQPNATYYWYADPSGAQAWYDPAKYDDRGFAQSWSQDSVTRIVHQTQWYTESHALAGKPRTELTAVAPQRALGTPASPTDPGSPPGDLDAVASVENEIGVRNVLTGGTNCTSLGAEPPASSYPLRLIPTLSRRTTYQAGILAAVVTEIDCRNVDVNGNVLRADTKTSIDGVFGPALTTEQTFTGTTQCKNVPGTLKVKKSDGGGTLTEEYLQSDSFCRPISKYSPGPSGTYTNRTTMTYGSPFGQLLTSVSGGVTKRLTYDTKYALYVTEERSDDSATAISTINTYDDATGLLLSSAGPTVVKRNGSAYTSPYASITRYYLHDGFGRKLAVAKQPFTLDASSTATAALVPRAVQANGAVEAYEYRDMTDPPAVVSYRFSVAKTYSIAGPVPQTDDVSKNIAYRDGLGRVIQVRERLGGGGAADAAARVTQTAAGYKVASAVLYDGAGRSRVALEPFYADGEAFVDYSTTAIPATRGTVTTYDEKGRPWCTSYQYVAGTAPGDATSCTSNSSHSPSFRLATETRYATRVFSGSLASRGPYGGRFLATEAIPPDVNVHGGSTARVTLLGAAGEELGGIDGDGNFTWILRDGLGREVGSWREAGNGSVATPQPASTIQYNVAGQVDQVWDANSSRIARKSRYDEAGRLVYLTTDPATGEGIEYVYGAGDLGRVTEVHAVTYPIAAGAAVVKRIAKNHYDLPYVAADAGYSYVAGKLSWTENDDTTIVYGYDDAGRVWRRDQFFARLDATKRFTVSSTYGTDGRVLESRVVNPYDATKSFLYQVDYDSAGRPVGLGGNYRNASDADVTPRAQFYQAVQNGSAYGAYDALGRVPLMRADDGLAVSARRYNPYSGQLEGECKRFGGQLACEGSPALDASADIYRTDLAAATYQGTKLSTYRDSGTATDYSTTYLPSGRVDATRATPYAPAGPLTQDWVETFTYNGIGNIDSVTTTRDSSSGNSRPDYDSTQRYAPETPTSGQALDRVVATTNKVTTGVAPETAGSTTYEYDLLGHLTRVTRTNGESESLYYAPGGELLYRQIGERFVFYVGEYATVTPSGTPGCGSTCTPQVSTVEVDNHVIFAGTRVASIKPARTLYYFRTRLGSVVATTMGGGDPGAGYRYGPYGVVELGVNETDLTRSELGYSNALRLTGALIYLKSRVYDAESRTFLQADSVDRLRYAYVNGDPVNLSDPEGLEANSDNNGSRLELRQDGTLIRLVEISDKGDLKVVAAWDTQTPMSAESAQQFANSIGLAVDRVNSWIGERIPGTKAGEYAVNFYNRIIYDPRSGSGAVMAASIGKFFASQWTRDTALRTAIIVVGTVIAEEGAAAAEAASAAREGVSQSAPCAGACGPPQHGPKTPEQMARDLANESGRQSVPFRTPSEVGHYDLTGKPHFDKATQSDIPTPHVQSRPLHVGPNGETNTGPESVRPATTRDIRVARKLLERAP